jgi:hypothetical protein
MTSKAEFTFAGQSRICADPRPLSPYGPIATHVKPIAPLKSAEAALHPGVQQPEKRSVRVLNPIGYVKVVTTLKNLQNKNSMRITLLDFDFHRLADVVKSKRLRSAANRRVDRSRETCTLGRCTNTPKKHQSE